MDFLKHDIPPQFCHKLLSLSWPRRSGDIEIEFPSPSQSLFGGHVVYLIASELYAKKVMRGV
jgi:hypothetical protein